MRARGGRRSVLSEQPAGNDTFASAERAGSVALAGGDDAFARGGWRRMNTRCFG